MFAAVAAVDQTAGLAMTHYLQLVIAMDLHVATAPSHREGVDGLRINSPQLTDEDIACL